MTARPVSAKAQPKWKAQKWVEHVVEEGSREHVMFWDNNGRHCSCPNCEVNRAIGLTPRTPRTRKGEK